MACVIAIREGFEISEKQSEVVTITITDHPFFLLILICFGRHSQRDRFPAYLCVCVCVNVRVCLCMCLCARAFSHVEQTKEFATVFI